MTLNAWCSCLCYLSERIINLNHYPWLLLFFLCTPSLISISLPFSLFTTFTFHFRPFSPSHVHQWKKIRYVCPSETDLFQEKWLSLMPNFSYKSYNLWNFYHWCMHISHYSLSIRLWVGTQADPINRLLWLVSQWTQMCKYLHSKLIFILWGIYIELD